MNIPLEVVDELTGKKLGRAKSATYRTADLVGLDVLSQSNYETESRRWLAKTIQHT
ncbi:hypothetical protein ACP8HZ_07415 [Francisella noatunensis]